MTAVLGLIHAIFIPVYFKWKKLDQRNIWARIGNRLYAILTFNIYVRIVIQAYITILLSWFGEIYEFKVKTGAEIISYSINVLICVLIFTFYGLWIWQIKKAHPQLIPIKQFYFTEFFTGLKNKTTYRIYPLIFWGQRIISCLLVILFGSLNLTIKMAILSAIQLLSLLYLLIIRPYEKVKDMISECLSQCIMTFFCWVSIYFNTKDQWNSVINWIFIGTLMASTIVTTLIAFIDFFIIIVKKIKNSWWNNNKVQQFRANRQTVVSQIGQDFANAISREYEAQMKSREENKTNRSGKLNFKIWKYNLSNLWQTYLYF